MTLTERYQSLMPLIKYLKEKELNPKAFTIDGHKYVIKAINEV